MCFTVAEHIIWNSIGGAENQYVSDKNFSLKHG